MVLGSAEGSPPELGPVEWIVIEFPGDALRGEIAAELRTLVDRGLVRIIDLLVVRKDSDGRLSLTELETLAAEQADPFEQLDGDVLGLLSEDDVARAGAELHPDSTALLVVWENRWAADLARAVQRQGGTLLTHDRVPAAAVRAALDAVTLQERINS